MLTEAGQLEQEALLMVESLRRYGGSLKDTPLYSYQVRAGREIAESTVKGLESFGVQHQALILNSRYPNYPLANKPLLCAHVEQEIDAEMIVFLDSDLVFFSEPKEFLLPADYDLGIRPEHNKMIGSSGAADPNNAFWDELHAIAQVKNDLYVMTTVDRQEIRAFFNSGVVAVRRSAGIFTAWKENFEKLVSTKDVSSINKENFYFEQSMFSATVCAVTDKIWYFSPGYNYPIHFHNRIIDTERRESFDQIVCIHDHLFREREWYRERIWVKTLRGMKRFDRRSPKYQWLYQYLERNTPAHPVQWLTEQILFSPIAQSFMPSKR
jgi:hypothetical protein